MLPFGFLFIILQALAQTPEPPSLQLVQPQGQAAPPPGITLQDALVRAKKLDTQYQLAITDAAVAREDRFQARSSLLPTVTHTTDYLRAQGRGAAPSGPFRSE